jgi:flavin reductase (DIM6/NTAB) family NADH-FMN oxidoreductase RutF
VAAEPRDGVHFRRALGHYATGVAILTAVTRSGEHLGITVNSFSSASLEPPLVSVCLGEFLASLRQIRAAKAFNISILCSGQEALSVQFARSGAEKWRGVRYGVASNGVRIVEPNLAVLECSRYRVYPAGDHHILLGRVERFSVNGIQEPLLFYRGEYRTLTAAAGSERYGT